MSLPQHGGEGKANYKGNKTNSNLKQHGGEGGNLGKKTSINWTPSKSVNTNYTGPGRNLSTEGY